ncbi:MAG TPA: hemolysin family protein [Bacteroidales bacterium]|nr:hemolysin family protein [Bacteroidales bacterium]
MNNLFISALLFILYLLFVLFYAAFKLFNRLEFEIDLQKSNKREKGVLFIIDRIYEFKITLKTILIFLFTACILYLRVNLSQLCHATNPVIIYLCYILFAGLFIVPFFITIANVLGEIAPNKIIKKFRFLLIIIYVLLFPVIKLFVLFSKLLPYGDNENENNSFAYNIEDLNKFVAEDERFQHPHADSIHEVKLFRNALEFSELKIRDCMTPRTEIVSVDYEDIDLELADKFINSGFSRIIIYKDSIDNILGYIKSNNLFLGKNLKNYIKSLAIFPETMPLNKLLRYFIRTSQSLAIVVDEFGGTSGIISLEDILEEIFGEIDDEHDHDDLIERKISDKEFILSARLEIDYLNETFQLNIDENDDYETLAGFILHHTEKIPTKNEIIHIGRFSIKILKVSNTRVELVKVRLKSKN